MKITYREPSVKFSSLKCGDTFIYKNRLKPFIKTGLSCAGDDFYNAINLENGSLEMFASDDDVEIVDAELLIR